MKIFLISSELPKVINFSGAGNFIDEFLNYNLKKKNYVIFFNTGKLLSKKNIILLKRKYKSKVQFEF